MCWSLPISIATASAETVLLLYIVGRGVRSNNPELRKHLIYLPGMLTILIMEVIEAMLWARPEELAPIEMADTAICPKRNRGLTLFTWLFLLPWQPFFVLYQDRRATNSEKVRDILMAPQVLAFVLASSFDLLVIYSLFARDPVLRSMKDSQYKGIYNTVSCTYVGTHGHLHWTVRVIDSYLTPNIFTYILLWSCSIFAHPLRTNCAIWTLVLFLLQIAYYGGSFEAGSIWCWSAVLLFAGLAYQSYKEPLEVESAGSVDSVASEKEVAGDLRLHLASNQSYYNIWARRTSRPKRRGWLLRTNAVKKRH